MGSLHQLFGLAHGPVAENEAPVFDVTPDGDRPPTHWAGRFEEAVEAFEAGAALSGRHPYILGSLASTYADWGKVSEARTLHQELTARQTRDYVPFTLLAVSAGTAAEPELSLDLARKAMEAREPVFLLMARVYPDLARLRADPGFEDVLQGLKLPGRS